MWTGKGVFALKYIPHSRVYSEMYNPDRLKGSSLTRYFWKTLWLVIAITTEAGIFVSVIVCTGVILRITECFCLMVLKVDVNNAFIVSKYFCVFINVLLCVFAVFVFCRYLRYVKAISFDAIVLFVGSLLALIALGMYTTV